MIVETIEQLWRITSRHFRTFISAAIAMDVSEHESSKIIKQVLKVLTNQVDKAIKAPNESEWNSMELKNVLCNGIPNYPAAIDSYPYAIKSTKTQHDSDKFQKPTVKAVILESARRILSLDIINGNAPDYDVFKPGTNLMKALMQFPARTRPIQITETKIRRGKLDEPNYILCDRHFDGPGKPYCFEVSEKGHLRKKLVELDHANIKNGNIYTSDEDHLKNVIKVDAMFHNIKQEKEKWCVEDNCLALCHCKSFLLTFKERDPIFDALHHIHM